MLRCNTLISLLIPFYSNFFSSLSISCSLIIEKNTVDERNSACTSLYDQRSINREKNRLLNGTELQKILMQKKNNKSDLLLLDALHCTT